jgi:hypothetical protein
MIDSHGKVCQKAGDVYKLGLMFEQIIRYIHDEDTEIFRKKKFDEMMPEKKLEYKLL